MTSLQRAPSPWQRLRTRDAEFWLRVSASGCALVGLAALVFHVLGFVPMPFFLTFLGVPSVILLFTLAAYARWIHADVFLRCLAVGLVGGLVATLAYDVTRLVLNRSGVFNYDGFTAIYIFGSWISESPTTTLQAAVAGWTYHFWNGMSFGVFYALTFGRRRWLWGAGYGLFMEMCMLGLFPLFLRVTNQVDFIMLSLLGHLVYGAVLGLIAQRYALNWSDAKWPLGR